MGRVDDLLKLPPFGLTADEKRAALVAAVKEEWAHHYAQCSPFQRWCDRRGALPGQACEDLGDLPFLPVGIFKRMALKSVPDEQIVRVLASSATTSQIPSQVFLDAETRTRRMKSLSSILTHLLGGARRPFVVLDVDPHSNPASQSNRELGARAAGMRGFLMAATQKVYALSGGKSEAMDLDVDLLIKTTQELKATGQPFCFLGYTYVLYQYVIRPLLERGIQLDLPDNVRIMHFGGWKKLRDHAVDKATLNAQAAQVFGVPTRCICDIYGFTEQLGVIYPDDADGKKRAPTFSEVFVRDPRTFQLLPDGSTGLLQFVCPLPHGYPGVSVLLDDLGRITGREPGADGMTGTAFEIVGRADQAETRGCGDTLPQQVYSVTRSNKAKAA